MRKRTLILLSTFFVALILFSGIVYANNTSDDMKNDMNEAGSTVVDGAEHLANDVKTGINDVASDIVDGAEHLGDDVRNGVGNAENGVEGALNIDNTTTTNYVATRTTGDSTGSDTATATGINTNNPTTWIWVIVAIAAVIIVALVWYYASQNTTNKHDDE